MSVVEPDASLGNEPEVGELVGKGAATRAVGVVEDAAPNDKRAVAVLHKEWQVVWVVLTVAIDGYGIMLHDTQSGYRLYPLKKLKWTSLITSRYEAELEIMVFAAWHGVNIKEIPIKVYYPPREERVSHFRPFKDFGRISILNTALCFGAGFYGWPMMMWRKLVKRQ